MKRNAVPLALALALVALSGCERAQQAGNEASVEAAKEKTIAASLDQNSRFFRAAKAAGVDATLGGSEPYTVLIPDDAAFDKLPAGTFDNWLKPESRAQVTQVLTYHILPGTVLAADIGKAIDNADGRAVLATMGGETLTATKEGDNIVLSDPSGGKATVTKADQTHSNGVVHRINAVLIPPAGSAGATPEPSGG